MNFSLEKAIVLAFYKFERQERIVWFTKQYCKYFKKEISTQTLLYEISKFRNVDPANNVTLDEIESEYLDVWKYYISDGRTDELKEAYTCFKKNERISTVFDYEGSEHVDYIVHDGPMNKPLIIEVTESKIQRDNLVLEHALSYAGHICELMCSNELFIRKSGDYYYTEGHHLIPLKYQNEFDYSLDVEANIVSLCPICHRQLHYGMANREKLKVLYENRINRLEKCKIGISFNDLLRMYE